MNNNYNQNKGLRASNSLNHIAAIIIMGLLFVIEINAYGLDLEIDLEITINPQSIKIDKTLLIKDLQPILTGSNKELLKEGEEITEKIKENTVNNQEFNEYKSFATKIDNEFKPEDPNYLKELSNKKGIDVSELLARYYPDFKNNKENTRKFNQLLIFVSTSMPANSFKQLAIQAKKIKGILVLRGMIKDSIRETAELVQSITQEGVPVVINPTLFRTFAIDAVPSFVVVAKEDFKCVGAECNETPMHDKISGNVSLEHALEQISQNGNAANHIATKYLLSLRGNL